MVIYNNQYTFSRQAMAALRLIFPTAKIIDQEFNNEFRVEFTDGKIGYCGVVNGPLECNMYWSQDHMDKTGQPYDTVDVANIYEKNIIGYNGEWTDEDGTLVLDCGSMDIVEENLRVWIDRGEYVVARGSIVHLKSMANKYMLMLDAITSTGMLDGPDVLLFPETMTLKLATGEQDMWGEERCFFKTMKDL